MSMLIFDLGLYLNFVSIVGNEVYMKFKFSLNTDRPVYILPLVIYNLYWPIIGHLCCITLFF